MLYSAVSAAALVGANICACSFYKQCIHNREVCVPSCIHVSAYGSSAHICWPLAERPLSFWHTAKCDAYRQASCFCERGLPSPHVNCPYFFRRTATFGSVLWLLFTCLGHEQEPLNSSETLPLTSWSCLHPESSLHPDCFLPP